MIEIVVEVIVFREAPQVAVLHFMEITELGSPYGWHLIDYKKNMSSVVI